MRDYANRQSLIHPTWRDRLRDAIADLRVLSCAMTNTAGLPEPHDDSRPHPGATDPRQEAKLQDALWTLGPRWRGRHDCNHTYTNSDGDTIQLENTE